MKLLIVTQKVDQNDQLLGFFIGWIKRLAEKFEGILVICLEKGEFDLPGNVQVVTLGKDRRWPKLFWLFNFYKYIFQYRKKYEAVLVHMNPIWMILGGLCWRLMGKKNYLWYTSGGVTFKLKLAEKLTHQVFTASSESFRVPSQKVIVTGHGIDTELFKPDLPRSNLKERASRFDLGGIKILSVGRIAPVKNYEVLISAAKILKDRGFNFEIDIIGEAPMAADRNYELGIRNKVKELELGNFFKFLGKVDHKSLPSYYQSHDLFVHLSKTGSLDKGLLEAMASGMRVLSSNDWSQRNLPSELVFHENDPIELANKIQNIFKTDFREQLREYVVKNHNLDGLIEKISYIAITQSRAPQKQHQPTFPRFMKKIIKILILTCLYAFYKLASLFYREKGTAVLMYHSIGDNDYNFTVRPSVFEKQIKYLKDHHFKFLTLAEFNGIVQEGIAFSDKNVLITFDDGYKDFSTTAWPILKKYQAQAVLFVHTDRKSANLENDLALMSWEDIKNDKESGLEIGSHTDSHPNLKDISENETRLEIERSEAVFLEKLGEAPKVVAYPGGKFNESIISVFKKREYKLGFTMDRGLVKKNDHPFRIKRNGLEKQTSFLEFKVRVTGANNWYQAFVNGLKN